MRYAAVRQSQSRRGITIKPGTMIRQHTEIDLVRLKPDPTVTMNVAHRPMAAIT